MSKLDLIKKGLSSVKEYGIASTYYRTVNSRRRRDEAGTYMRDTIFSDTERIRQRGYSFESPKKISVLVPLYNTNKKFLKEMIDSVIEQTYPNWELCLADASDSEHGYVEKTVTDYMRIDERIIYKRLDENKGISANTNACAKLAGGDYIALLDHDDLLAPNALFEVMKAISDGADFIYTDEMTFESDILFPTSIHFKPDFAPDNLKSLNYICHLCVFSKELFLRAGEFDSMCDGSQDYDMALRLTDCAEKIVHIPKVLYYWRSHQGSVSANLSSKPYCITSAIDAIEKSVERSGMSGKAEKNAKTVSTYRVKYDIKENPKVSVIIVSDGRIKNVEKTLKSIVEKSQFDNYELILADTERSSKKYDFTLKKYKDFKDFRVAAVSGRQTKYQLCNKVAREAKGEQLLFINAGCEAHVGGCIREMLMFSQRDDVGAVGAKILAPNKTIRHAGYVLGINGGVASVFFGARYADMGYMYHLCYAQNYNAVSSECMMIKKSVFEKLGGFDESYHNSYSDIDLCLRLRDCGYLNVFTPFAEFVSISKDTLQSPQNRRDRQLFSVKWADRLSKPDEYYNINLSTQRNDFSL